MLGVGMQAKGLAGKESSLYVPPLMMPTVAETIDGTADRKN